MTHYLSSQPAAAAAGRRNVPGRAFVAGAAEMVRIWLERRRQRQELLNHITDDHRAVTDLGVSRSAARDWVERPFWRD